MLGRSKRSIQSERIETLIGQRFGKTVSAREPAGTEQVKRRTANTVGTGLGHRVDDAAGTASELGRVTGSHDLEFTNGFLRQRKG